MTREEPVKFKNRTRHELYGIAHIPANKEAEKKTGIIFFSPGYRIASNRLYVNLSRKLAQKGFYSLRFDPVGCGEGRGDIEETMLFDLDTLINRGQFVDDVVDATELFIERYGLEEISLAGLCGGATTVFLAAPHCRKVHSLILMGFPVLFDPLDTQRSTLDSISARYTLGNYFRAITNFNMLSLDCWKTVLRKIKDIGLPELTNNLLRSVVLTTSKNQAPSHSNLNKILLDTLEKIREDVDVNFIFGEYDTWKLYFEREFEQKLVNFAPNKHSYSKFAIKNANHIFALRECQEELLDVIQRIIGSRMNPESEEFPLLA